jgi:hypothetical protein
MLGIGDRPALPFPSAPEMGKAGSVVTLVANRCDTMSMSDPEVLAATNEPVGLAGPRTDVTLRLAVPGRLSDRIRHVRKLELFLSDVRASSSPGGFYSIYLNLPRAAGARPEAYSHHWIHTFYILDGNTSVAVDVTAKMAVLESDSLIDEQLTITIVPAPSSADTATSRVKIATATIGRIELVEKCR